MTLNFNQMINKDNIIRPRGVLHIMALDIEGNVMWSEIGENHVVTSGRTSIAKALAGVSDAHIAKIGIGTNGVEPTDGDTEITDVVYFDVATIEYPRHGCVRFNFSIKYTDAVGMSIREFGLFTAGGSLFSRKVREPIEKTRFMSLVVAWEITFE